MANNAKKVTLVTFNLSDVGKLHYLDIMVSFNMQNALPIVKCIDHLSSFKIHFSDV